MKIWRFLALKPWEKEYRCELSGLGLMAVGVGAILLFVPTTVLPDMPLWVIIPLGSVGVLSVAAGLRWILLGVWHWAYRGALIRLRPRRETHV